MRRDVTQQRRVEDVGRRDLERRRVELSEEVGTRLVERGREQRQVEFGRVGEQLLPLVAPELECLAMRAVGRAEAVLVVVRLVVQGVREERAVVALLQLDRVDPAFLGGEDQLLGFGKAALVVVPDLGNDVATGVVCHACAAEDEFPHQSLPVEGRVDPRLRRPMVLSAPNGGPGELTFGAAWFMLQPEWDTRSEPSLSTDEGDLQMSRVPGNVRLRNLAVGAAALALVVAASGAVARGAGSGSGVLSPAQRVQAHSYLVRNPAAYAAAKAKAAAAAGQTADQGAAHANPAATTVIKGWNGVTDPNFSPSDSTGTVGPTRYIELINDEYGIYDRTVAGTPTTLQTGTLATFTGDSGSSGGFSNLSDPQIIWDPGSNRFYYAALDVASNHLVVGWSKDGSPNGAADFCKYDMDFGYGTILPDYPKLGTTSDFLLIGANGFDSATGFSYAGSDISWLTKPGAGTTCPSQGTVNTFKKGTVFDVKNAGGSTAAFTPVPAVQTDSSATGWVAATDGNSPSTTLTVFPVTNDGSGNAVIPTTGTTITVASYSIPPNAPQKGTPQVLDTLDARIMQAVSGFDPAAAKTAIWTNLTIAGGAGSKVRWFELDPAGAAVLQTGDILNGSLYTFNAATAPDRVVNGSTTAFGSDMATVFSTSSSSAFPGIQAVTKAGTAAQSAFISLKTSAASDNDFSCDISVGAACRWGDYSAARPDPAADTSRSQGDVWFTNAFTVSGSPGWNTWNGALQLGAGPSPTVTSTNPSSSPRGVSNISVTVNGTGFASGAVASFSGTYVVVNSTSFVSATQLTANVTIHGVAALGPRNVTVTNPGGGAGTCTGCFTVGTVSGPPPTVTSASPISLARGSVSKTVTITGTGFVSGATASFSGTYVQVNSTTFVNSTTLTLNVTVHGVAATGARNVIVTNPGSSPGTCTGCFTVT